MTNLPTPKLGVVYPISYRVADHLTIPHIPLPSSVVTSPDRVLWWTAEQHITWLLVTAEKTWEAILPTVPRHPGFPVYIRHLYYADLHAFYAPAPDDLAMLPFCVKRQWWPEECVECGGELEVYDEWCLPRCNAHNPALIRR